MATRVKIECDNDDGGSSAISRQTLEDAAATTAAAAAAEVAGTGSDAAVLPGGGGAPASCSVDDDSPREDLESEAGETDILDIQNIRRLRDSGYLESIGVLLPKSMWVEAGFDRAVSQQILCGKKRNNENGDGDDAEEDERGVALANDIDRYSEAKKLRRDSRARKLRRAKKAKRAEARRKEDAKALFDTCLPMIQSYLASSRSAGEKEARQSSGKERAQAALDLERSRAADMREKSMTVRQKTLGTYKEMYSRERRRLVEEKNADVPDVPFIKAIECFLAQLRSDMDADA